MAYQLLNENFDQLLKELKKEYKVYAPVRFKKRGRFSDTDVIRYAEINTINEIAWGEKSHFSPKEVIYPITQTLFYFIEDEWKEAPVNDQKIIVFLRPCDINGIRRLDTIFLKNGPYEDLYYKKIREKVKFFMLECKESFDNCHCVSMNSNHTDDYSAALRFTEHNVYCHVKDDAFTSLFYQYGQETEFVPEYTQENKVKVELPNVEKMPLEIFNHDMWQEYSERCIACGRCNMVCITCSCFTTQDIAYSENPKNGERRRVWAGCHIDKFTDMAGGHSFRKDYGSRMRFKTMHKIYDYKKRFGEQMCVGCGRCDDMCPEYISYSNCINKLNNVLKEEGIDEK